MIPKLTTTYFMVKSPNSLTETGYLEDPVTIGQYSNKDHSLYHHMQYHNFEQRTKTLTYVYTKNRQESMGIWKTTSSTSSCYPSAGIFYFRE